MGGGSRKGPHARPGSRHAAKFWPPGLQVESKQGRACEVDEQQQPAPIGFGVPDPSTGRAQPLLPLGISSEES